jgi:hypothetical protein
MMTRLLFENTLVRHVLSPTTLTDGTVRGAPVDRAVSGGNEAAIVMVLTGSIAGTHAVTIEDSADGESGWAEVASAQIQGTVPTITADESNRLFEVGIRFTRRFVRVSITTTGALLDGGVIGAAIVLGELRFSPATR